MSRTPGLDRLFSSSVLPVPKGKRQRLTVPEGQTGANPFGKLTVCLVLCLLLGGVDQAQAQEGKKGEIVEVEVSEADKLKTLLKKGKIEGHLKDGTVLSGEVKDLKDEWLVLNLRKTLPPNTFPEGEHSLPIRDFSRIQVTRYEGDARVKVPLILGAVGVGLGLLASATEFAGESFNATYGAMIVSFAAAGVGGGYLVGKELDRKSTLVKLTTSLGGAGPSTKKK